MPINPPDYNAAQFAVSEKNSLRKDAKEDAAAFLAMADAFNKAHGGLGKLNAQVKLTNKIFEDSARRGDVFAGRRLLEFMNTSDKLSKVFQQSSRGWSSAFQDMEGHTAKSVQHLKSLAGHSFTYFNTINEGQRTHARLVEESKKIGEEINLQLQTQGGHLKEGILARRDQLKQALAVYQAELSITKALVAGGAVLSTWAATMGQAAFFANKFQKTFRDISMDFGQSLQFVQRVVDVAGSAKGLVSIEDAAKSIEALRKQGQAYAKDTQLAKTITQLSAVTGISVDSLADLSREMKVITGDTGPALDKHMGSLANTMVYFARQTDLTGTEVASLVQEMQPLIAALPRGMEDKAIPAVLALGDAFKSAGLDAAAMVSSLDEMKDLLSSKGMIQAMMITRFSGRASFGELTRGTNLAEQGKAQLEAYANAMKTNIGGTPQTTAKLYERMGLGSYKDLMAAYKLTPEELKDKEKQIDLKTKEAEADDNLNKELNKMLSGPFQKIESFFRAIERFAVGVGARALENITDFFTPFSLLLTGVKKYLIDPVTGFLKTISVFEPIMKGMMSGLTFMLSIYLLKLPFMLKGFFSDMWKGFKQLDFVFAKGDGPIQKTTASLKEETAAQMGLAESCNIATAAKRGETAANMGGSILGGGAMLGGGGALGGAGKAVPEAEKVVEKVATEGLISGTLKKITGSKVGQAVAKGAGAVSRIGGSIATKGKGLLAKGLGKWGGRLIPGAGGVIGTIMGVGEAAGHISEDPKNLISWAQGTCDVVSGMLAFGGWTTILFSGLFSALSGILGWFKGQKKDDDYKDIKEVGGWHPNVRGGQMEKHEFGESGNFQGGVPMAARGGGGGAGGIQQSSVAAGIQGGLGVASSAPIGSSIDGVKVTHYGYAGDSSGDSNSMGGKGDRGNKLEPGVSVALSQSARAHILGKNQLQSTGLMFQWGGRSYRDDDHAPESTERLDVYDPYYTGVDAGCTPERLAKQKAEMQAAGISTLQAPGGSGGITGGTTAGQANPSNFPQSPGMSELQQKYGTQKPGIGTTGPIAPNLIPGADQGSTGMATSIAQAALQDSGTSLAGGVDKNVACAHSVSQVLSQAGVKGVSSDSTSEMYKQMIAAGWTETDPNTPGAVIISPTEGSNTGHVGVVGPDGNSIYSNSSRTGVFEQNYNTASWQRYFGGKGLSVHAMIPPGGAGQQGAGQQPDSGIPANSIFNKPMEPIIQESVGVGGTTGPNVMPRVKAGSFAVNTSGNTDALVAHMHALRHDVRTDPSHKIHEDTLATIRQGNRLHQEHYRHLQTKDWLGPSLFDDASTETLTA